MIKNTMVFGLVLVLAVILPGLALGAELTWEGISGDNVDIRTILFTRDDPGEIFAGSGQGVLHSLDSGSNWRVVFTVKGANKKINALQQDETDKNRLYAATGEGLFYSPDKGRQWQRLYRGRDYLERECAAVAVYKEDIYLGTGAGLLISRDKGRSWNKAEGELGKTRILSVVFDHKEPGSVYAVCADGLFRATDRGGSWEKIYRVIVLADDVEAGESAQEPEEPENRGGIRHLVVVPSEPACLYLAASTGVYRRDSNGKDWQALTGYGLLSSDILFLAVSRKGVLYALTGSGIFSYEGKRWYEESLRLSAGRISSIALDSGDNLYAACAKGLYKAVINDPGAVEPSQKQGNEVSGIPSITDVQQAAIAYAEVSPEKIKQWRKQAARKAWLPELSMGLGRDTSELLHWEGGSTTKADDDVLRKGQDTVDWDLSLKWDLGEIIWNEDQTSIDVRSRLMVELRQDILDEVTKLYFERVRVGRELEQLGPEDRKKRQDKQLRLKELAASLDGLTGGYFSAGTR